MSFKMLTDGRNNPFLICKWPQGVCIRAVGMWVNEVLIMTLNDPQLSVPSVRLVSFEAEWPIGPAQNLFQCLRCLGKTT